MKESQDTTTQYQDQETVKPTLVQRATKSASAQVDKAKQAVVNSQLADHVRTAQAIFQVATMLLFTAITVLTISLSWSDSPLVYFIVGAIVIYVTIFLIYIFSRKDKEKRKNATKDYKSITRIVKISLSLVNLAIAVMILINTLQDSNSMSNLLQWIVAGFSGLVIFIKTIFALFSLWRAVRKRNKIVAKRNK